MIYYFDHFMQLWLLPPGLNLLLAFSGFMLWRFWPHLGKFFVAFAFISLWIFSMPVIAQLLVDELQYQYPPLLNIPKDATSSAIVILDAGLNTNAPEYGIPTVSSPTLARLRYGAFLHKQTKIPILVSGNYPISPSINEAAYMAKALKEYFNVETRWQEAQGDNTNKEAVYATKILKKDKITKIYLVTHALHMPRAIYAFQDRGLEIIPAPTGYVSSAYHLGKLSGVLPTMDALQISISSIHEYIGLLWYRLLKSKQTN